MLHPRLSADSMCLNLRGCRCCILAFFPAGEFCHLVSPSDHKLGVLCLKLKTVSLCFGVGLLRVLSLAAKLSLLHRTVSCPSPTYRSYLIVLAQDLGPRSTSCLLPTDRGTSCFSGSQTVWFSCVLRVSLPLFSYTWLLLYSQKGLPGGGKRLFLLR